MHRELREMLDEERSYGKLRRWSLLVKTLAVLVLLAGSLGMIGLLIVLNYHAWLAAWSAVLIAAGLIVLMISDVLQGLAILVRNSEKK